MKPAQVLGLALTLLAISYFSSFAGRLGSPDEQGSATLGIGLAIVCFFVFLSACIVVPTSFVLWDKKARMQNNFNGPFWKAILVINSTLAVIYTCFGAWFAGELIKVWLRS